MSSDLVAIESPFNVLQLLTSGSSFSLSLSLSQVNIIPVIAKADTVSRSELSSFKGRVSYWHII